MNDEENNIALAEEQEVSRCIEDMYKVFVIGNESIPALLQSLESVLLPLFGLYCFSRHGVSHLRSSCQELVCWYILKAEKSRVMVVLKQLCGLPGPLPILRPRCLFLAGEEGGVRSVIQSTDESGSKGQVPKYAITGRKMKMRSSTASCRSTSGNWIVCATFWSLSVTLPFQESFSSLASRILRTGWSQRYQKMMPPPLRRRIPQQHLGQ
uniref:TANGO6 HEAT repeat domain-containing protein n=1 Tax=Eptatretus burgeri TaxID=7764 RepID=A0A8C4WYK8_EPTBU